MSTVWVVFLGAALVLAVGGLLATRVRGDRSPVFGLVAFYVFALAIGTALFPFLLRFFGALVWAACYVGFVVTVTIVMTVSSVKKARHLARH